MRDRADEVAPQVTIDGLWHDTSRFFNRGTSGQWRTFLGSEDLDRYEARVRRLATADLADWAHGGWRGYRRLKRANDHAEEKPLRQSVRWRCGIQTQANASTMRWWDGLPWTPNTRATDGVVSAGTGQRHRAVLPRPAPPGVFVLAPFQRRFSAVSAGVASLG
jgi:hypothetical protein